MEKELFLTNDINEVEILVNNHSKFKEFNLKIPIKPLNKIEDLYKITTRYLIEKKDKHFLKKDNTEKYMLSIEVNSLDLKNLAYSFLINKKDTYQKDNKRFLILNKKGHYIYSYLPILKKQNFQIILKKENSYFMEEFENFFFEFGKK